MRTRKITTLILALLAVFSAFVPSTAFAQSLDAPDIDTDGLHSVISRGDSIIQNGEFTDESLTAYSIAYENAITAVFYGQSQEEVDNAKAELDAAIDRLVPVNQSGFETTAPVVLYLSGDANCDTKVNIKDATAIQKHVANLIKLTDIGFIAADTNSDGVINIKDATEIQKHIAGVSVNAYIGTENEFVPEPATTVSSTEGITSTAEAVTTAPTESTVVTQSTLPTELTKPTEPNETTKSTVSTDATEFAEPSATDVDDYYTVIDDLWFWIETAENYLAPGNNHIDETALVLQKEIDNAKELYFSDTATCSEITAQIKALQDAIDELVEPDLDRDELWAVIERGNEIVENGNFTEASYEAYSIASTEAMVVYHYGDTQDEVDNAKALLEAAINALVPIEEISFTVAEEFRIDGYGSDKTELYLITSTAEMKAVIAKIQGSGYGSFYTPTVSEKYSDDYFKNNSLIISLNCVGGSCCTQTIDRLTVDGDTLTVHRTVYKPEIVLTDMNDQYVLIEVSANDTKNVKSLADSTTIARKGGDTTDSKDETITIYFSNSQYWSDVNIHFWGGAYETIWPGSEMEFVEHNIYGQDVYKLEIPADTIGIVFNEGVNKSQTVDIVAGISDGYGFYPTETQNGKWKVESYIYEVKENGVTTKPSESATTSTIPVTIPDTTVPDENTNKENEISFDVIEQCRVEGYGSDNEELYLIRSVAGFEAVLSKIEGETDGYLYTKPVIDEKYSDEYFMSDSLIVSLNVVGGSCCTQTIDSVTVDDSTLTVHRTLYKPLLVLCDMNYQYVLIEVSNADINGVTTVENHNTYVTVE